MGKTEGVTAKTSADRIRQIVGPIDDQRLARIEALLPTLAELEAAVAWIDGGDAAMHEERRELSGRIAEIFKLLEADLPPEPDR